MSYEGREDHLCQIGHRWSTSCYDSGTVCPRCGGPSVWSNAVDDTNGNALGTIPEETWVQFLVAPEQSEICNLGHSHVVQPALYRPPTRHEQQAARHYWDGTQFMPIRFIFTDS